MAIYIRPFKKEDIKELEPIEPAIGHDGIIELAEQIETSGLAVTAIKNGEVVGCGGVHPVTEREGELWVRISVKAVNFKFEMARSIREVLKIIEERFEFPVLNAYVQDKFCVGKRMLVKFGYELVRHISENGIKYAIYSKTVK